MKVENFPARISARRNAALHRVESQLASGFKRTNLGLQPLTREDRNRLALEADTLLSRIRPEATLRALRSKKLKANGWTPERAYRRRGKV